LFKKCTYISGYSGPDSCLIAVAWYVSGEGSADEAESGEEVLGVLHLEAERMYGTITRVVWWDFDGTRWTEIVIAWSVWDESEMFLKEEVGRK